MIDGKVPFLFISSLYRSLPTRTITISLYAITYLTLPYQPDPDDQCHNNEARQLVTAIYSGESERLLLEHIVRE